MDRVRGCLPSERNRHLGLRLPFLIIASFLMQGTGIVLARLTGNDLWVRGGLILGYITLLAAVTANMHLVGMWIVGLGALLNTIAIFANGGLMPISQETLISMGSSPEAVEARTGEYLPGLRNKVVVLPRDYTQLWFLGDTLVLPGPLRRAGSIGDALALIGIMVLMAQLVARRYRQTATVTSPASGDDQPRGER